MPSDFPRKVLIIGAGIAGLFTALAFKRVSRNLGFPINIMIFERASPSIFHESSTDGNPAQFFILWRWAIDLLRELGLGHRLARIARPIVTFTSSDAETKESLVQYPPLDAITSTTGASPTDIPMGDPSLPPMVGVRRVDLVRLLMLALTEDGDVVLQKEAQSFGIPGAEKVINFGATEGARNGDDNYIDAADSDPYGLDLDMARGDWFEREKFLDRIPFLFLGYNLESFIISSSTGIVTVRFSNEHVEMCDMVIGADGINSKVRELIGSDRYPAHHAGAFICHGITRTLLPPPRNYPTEFPDGTVIPDITIDDINTLLPSGSSFSIIGGGSSIGLSNLGNGLVGWNVVVAQLEEGQHLHAYAEQNQRKAVSRAVARTSLGPSSFATLNGNNSFPLSGVNQNVLSSIGEAPTLHYEPETMAKLEGGPEKPQSQMTAFEIQIREQLAARNTEIFDSSANSEPVKKQDGVFLTRGADARALALKLLMGLQIPATAQAIVARTDPSFTVALDVMDMADRWLDSYTSPTFHPGRIIMIGDAAHPIATNAHNGSVGAALAMADGASLALLFAKYFGPLESTNVQILDEEADIELYEKLGLDFDKKRCELSNSIMREVRNEGGWDRVENTWFRSLLRMSYKYTPTTWVKASFATRLTRGGIPLPEPKLAPVATLDIP
ncbi:hypothetical protein HK096_007803, partial [Nowakowskiella sp. JEL0078]